jgi:hypothetical protein
MFATCMGYCQSATMKPIHFLFTMILIPGSMDTITFSSTHLLDGSLQQRNLDTISSV